MSGQDIIIAQLRADVARLEAELADAHKSSEYQTRRIEHYRTQMDFCERRAEKAERERDEAIARAEKAEANYAFMVERAADQRLDGYRELGARAAAAEERAEKAERERDEERHLADLRGEMLNRRTRAERVGEAVLSLEGDEEPRDLRSRAASAERYGYDSYGALLRAIADALKEADDADR